MGFAATVAVLVLAGFSRTFFLPLAHRTFSAPWFVYVHGLLFFTWITLLVVQSFLVASGRTKVHVRLGLIAFAWIPLMVASGVAVAIWSSARDFRKDPTDGVVNLFFGELMDMLMFATLAGAALLKRRSLQTHKRLMLLATLAILGAAIGRIPEIQAVSPYIPVVLLVAIAAYDVLTRSVVHSATLWGGVVLLVGTFTQPAIGATSLWLATGRELLQRVHY